MKKVLLMMLCLVLMTSTYALAGTMPLEFERLTDSMSLVYTKPEGVKSIAVDDVFDMKVLTYTMEDESMPVYVLTVSHSEVLSGTDVTDLSTEQLETIVAYTAFDSEGYTYEIREMEDGWPAVLILYEGESDWVDAFTINAGYLVQMHGYHMDFRPLTDAEDQIALTLLDSVNVVQADDTDMEITAGMPNPIQEATADDFAVVAGFAPTLPEDAEQASYYTYAMGSELVELQFTSKGIAYTFRAESGDTSADISGMYIDFAHEEAVLVHGMEGTLKYTDGAEGECQWRDEDSDINFSLTMDTGATSDGLLVMADQLLTQ